MIKIFSTLNFQNFRDNFDLNIEQEFCIKTRYFLLFICPEKKEGAPLKIIRMSHVAGSVEGGKEVWLLSDKIDGNTLKSIIYYLE